jgi:hypothetical protein
MSSNPSRAEINRANSQNSTGPTSPEGKARSSRNSFKHGLYSKDLLLPNEDPAEFDRLRASYRAEHLPINTTEDTLVNELAENFWRLRRMREFEARAMQPENIAYWFESGLLALVQRTMGSAERAFHRALTALRRLQKDRGFVPQNLSESAEAATEPPPIHPQPLGSTPAPQHKPGFVPEELPFITADPLSVSFDEALKLREHLKKMYGSKENPLTEAA